MAKHSWGTAVQWRIGVLAIACALGPMPPGTRADTWVRRRWQQQQPQPQPQQPQQQQVAAQPPYPGAHEFPIAWFTGNIVCGNDANCDAAALSDFRDLPGPFNLAINYFHPNSWRHSSPMPRALHNFSTVNYLDYLDQCSEQNISCMLGLPFQQVQQGKGAALAAQLAAPLAHHPALFGHFLYDEPWLEPGPPPTEKGTISVEAIASVYRALKDVDGAAREVVPCQAAHWINNDHGVGFGQPSPDFQQEESGAYNLSSFADRVMFDYYLARLNQTDRDRHINAYHLVPLLARRLFDCMDSDKILQQCSIFCLILRVDSHCRSAAMH